MALELHDVLEKAGKLPRAQRLAGIGAIYVLIAVVFFFFVYTPKQNELEALVAVQADLVAKKKEVQARAEDKEAYERELEDLTSQLKLALRQLPDDREIPDLLSRISTTGRKIGLEIRKFLPHKDEILHEYHAEVPVDLEIGGTYHDIAMFFDRLSKMSRIVYVQNVMMSDPKESNGRVQLTVTGTLTTFRFLTEEERKKSADAEQKGRKRK